MLAISSIIRWRERERKRRLGEQLVWGMHKSVSGLYSVFRAVLPLEVVLSLKMKTFSGLT